MNHKHIDGYGIWIQLHFSMFDDDDEYDDNKSDEELETQFEMKTFHNSHDTIFLMILLKMCQDILVVVGSRLPTCVYVYAKHFVQTFN